MKRTLTLFTALLLAPLAALAADRPNVVLILADDMGWGDVRCHGNDKIATPVLDRLQSQGVELDHFYVSPICSPTRASLLSGRHHFRLRVLNTTSGLEVLHGDEVTLAEALKPAGYVSLHFRRTSLVKELILTEKFALGDAAFLAQETPHREGKGWPTVNVRTSVRNPGTRTNAKLLGMTSGGGWNSETCGAGRPRRPSFRWPVR